MKYPRTVKELRSYLEQRMDDRAAADDEDALETYKRDELYAQRERANR